MRGTDDLEGRLRAGADGFPGAAPSPSGLDAVIARGRRGRTMAKATQLGAAASLVAGVAFAAPVILDRTPSTPEVATHIDEVVDREAPAVQDVVDVTSPWSGVVVDDPAVTFGGTAIIGARVTVDGFDVDVAPDGRWQITLELDEGEHVVEFRGVAPDGRVGRDAVTVTYLVPVALGEVDPSEEPTTKPEAEPTKAPAPKPTPKATTAPKSEPAPAPTKTAAPAPKPTPKAEPAPKPATVAFTANQKYGSCEEPVPYDEFWGTAQPGTEVWVWSEYGQKTVAVNSNGEWFARVEFPNAPQGHTFDVKTKSLHTEEKIYWSFVNNGTGGQEPEAVEWSAWQHNTEVEYDPPYNYYEGTATPGTTVHVASDYGNAQTVADGNGHWKTKVWFESAPYGTKTWTVVVESSAGDRNTFQFTGVRPEPAQQTVAFTSDQVHNSTDGTPPKSRYVGTAEPETKVWIYSEHGEAFVYANADGNYDVWAEFPTAPRGKTLAVKVKSLHTGEAHWYELQVV